MKPDLYELPARENTGVVMKITARIQFLSTYVLVIIYASILCTIN